MDSKELINKKMIDKIKLLLSIYGEWNLRCIYVDGNHKLQYGNIINIFDDKIQISVHGIPDEKYWSVYCIEQLDFVEPYRILDIYDPINI